jgi:hypothetical protein
MIDELAESAKLSVPRGILAVDDWIKAYNSKFAELIVAEAIRVMHQTALNYDNRGLFTTSETADVMSVVLKKHFGVE